MAWHATKKRQDSRFGTLVSIICVYGSKGWIVGWEGVSRIVCIK